MTSHFIVSFSDVFKAVLDRTTFDEHFGPMVGADSGPSGSILRVAANFLLNLKASVSSG